MPNGSTLLLLLIIAAAALLAPVACGISDAVDETRAAYALQLEKAGAPD